MAIVITSFNAASGTIALGAATTLTPVFSGGTGLILPGLIPVASGTAVKVNPPATQAYVLVVTDPSGATAQTITTITVTVPTEKKLGAGTGGGVIVGKNVYWVDSKPVYHIQVTPSPMCYSDHLAQTNEDTIIYNIAVNNDMTFQIVGLTDLSAFLTEFGLVWA